MGKIAVIDSGIGGLTVMKEILKEMPNESVIYFGDQKNCPYGDKKKEDIKKYIFDVVDFLMEFDLKALVIACNTATAIVLDELKDYCTFPVIGVIEPGASYAVEETNNGKVGVIATDYTIKSGIYERTLKEMKSDIEVYNQSCPKIVPLLENGSLDKEELNVILREYLFDFYKTSIDTLVLGCTHYPLVSEEIRNIIGDKVKLVNPAIRTVEKLKEYLNNNDTYRHEEIEGKYLFYTSGDKEVFDFKASLILNMSVCSTKEDDIFKKKESNNIESGFLS